MSSEKFVNIAKLITKYNFQIDNLPDNLKCVKCKLVLKDANLLSCECTFCRNCIDDMIASGIKFCPGLSKDCGKSSLSCFVSDLRANNSISRLTVKCPLNMCAHECQLANMEEHLRECRRKSEECAFRELGCKQNNLTGEEINGHLLQDNCGHSEILIAMVTNFNREIGILKHELAMKDDQIRMINDQIIHLENENKSTAQGKNRLDDRVRILYEKIEREIDDRRQIDELDSARVTEHVDSEIAAIGRIIESNKNQLATEMKSIRDDIRSLNHGDQSKNEPIRSTESEVQSIQLSSQVPADGVDAKFDLITNEDISQTIWIESGANRSYFIGTAHPYKYQLLSCNGGTTESLRIYLRIYCGPFDEELVWPFEGQVIITVTETDRLEVCSSISRQCRIDRPLTSHYRISDKFDFPHSELIAAGLDLSRGLRISCVIIPRANR